VTTNPIRLHPENTAAAISPPRKIEYLSPAAAVSMADRWFQIASLDHFWIRRRFEVLQRLAGNLIASVDEMAEVGCGHGLLQRQIEDVYGREVTGFDLNEFALLQNVSDRSKVCCYDISQMNPTLQAKFDLIFLFDVLEHISDEDSFLKAVLFHLRPQGKLIINVPAGQWAFSAYDTAAGHVRRYSMQTLTETACRSALVTVASSYWGLPLVPILLLRKVWLADQRDESKIINTGFDSRSSGLNGLLHLFSKCERTPQRFLGTSLMAVFAR
jgi:trans-aconitate methyltransferase